MVDTDDTGRAWSELTDELLELTGRLRTAYRTAAGEDGPSEEEITHALRTLGGAWSHLSGSVAIALEDPEVRGHLRRAAENLATAVTTTMADSSPDDAPRDPTDPAPPRSPADTEPSGPST